MARYIDAEKLIAKLHSGDKYLSMLPLEIANLQREFVREVEGYIDDTPTENVKPVVRGEWIDDYGSSWKCSVCGTETYVNEDFNTDDMGAYKMRYCHYCGADMRKESKTNDTN